MQWGNNGADGRGEGFCLPTLISINYQGGSVAKKQTGDDGGGQEETALPRPSWGCGPLWGNETASEGGGYIVSPYLQKLTDLSAPSWHSHIACAQLAPRAR